jgi:hypothetical protein
MGGGIDNGSEARLRRQLTLLADLNLDVAALQFPTTTRLVVPLTCCFA